MTTSPLSNFSPRSSSLLHFVLESTLLRSGAVLLRNRNLLSTFAPRGKGSSGCRITHLVSNIKRRYQSGQMGLTVNQLVFTFGGSNPPLRTSFIITLYPILRLTSLTLMTCYTERLADRCF